MTEEWRAIPGYEGIYEVSDLGRVRSLDRQSTAGRSLRGRIRAAAKDKGGYLRVPLHHGRAVRYTGAHRLVLEAFVGPCPPGMEACHNDGDPSNNALSNLRWDTKSANMLDKLLHGTNREALKTSCKHGHPFTTENTYITPSGHRRCRTCRREGMRAIKAERTHAQKEQHAHPVNPT